MIARTPAAFEVYKAGFEQVVTNAARDHGLLYGLATAMMALAHRLVRGVGVPAGLIVPERSFNQPCSARPRAHRAAPRPACAR